MGQRRTYTISAIRKALFPKENIIPILSSFNNEIIGADSW